MALTSKLPFVWRGRRLYRIDPARVRGAMGVRRAADGHTENWCPETAEHILVGPDRKCPACGGWAPTGAVLEST